MKFAHFLIFGACLSFGACTTTGGAKNAPQDARVKSPLPDAGPQVDMPIIVDSSDISEPAPYSPPSEPSTVQETVYEELSAFSELSYWGEHDPLPALRAFRITCELWGGRDQDRPVSLKQSEYGYYRDWAQACFAADYIVDEAEYARSFFETYFHPVTLSTDSGSDGLLTGYYIPEISVRRRPDAQYYEPILKTPRNEADKKRPRSKVQPEPGGIIAYGKPIDVFFMQVQGSGRLVFEDGERVLAAFASHNSQPYSSIGKALVTRGELTLAQASKQSIEAWMNAHSAKEVQALMNENARYVYFSAEPIVAAQPKGAMGVPLQAMGSIAIDPRYHPYGALVWLETRLPQSGGDYKAEPAGLLVSAQDTGGAIKGALRADLFFGSGDVAGEHAGVMKHKAQWSILLPTPLASQYLAKLALLNYSQ